MSTKWLAAGIVVLLLIALLLALLVGPSPGGPIIVIEPHPESDYTVTPPVVKGYTARWLVGCPNSTNANNEPDEAKPADVQDIPWKFVYFWPGAEQITVTLKSQAAPIVVGTITMTLDQSRKLEIKHEKPNAAPLWWFDGNELKGDKSVVEPYWPKGMFGEISDLDVLDLDGNPVDVKLEDLVDITIHHNHWYQYMECKQ